MRCIGKGEGTVELVQRRGTTKARGSGERKERRVKERLTKMELPELVECLALPLPAEEDHGVEELDG